MTELVVVSVVIGANLAGFGLLAAADCAFIRGRRALGLIWMVATFVVPMGALAGAIVLLKATGGPR